MGVSRRKDKQQNSNMRNMIMIDVLYHSLICAFSSILVNESEAILTR